jgi:hypothetical protein
MKRAAIFLSVLVAVVFVLIVVRETAAVFVMARSVHPWLGAAVLAALGIVYVVCLAVPAVMFLRLRSPLVPPRLDAPPAEVSRHLARVTDRLARHPRVDRDLLRAEGGLDRVLAALDAHAEREIRREASLVFVSTALSQTGRLDALFVLVAQTRLVWKVAHVYWQRPTPREFVLLYANVAATVFAAQSLEDLEMSELLEPLTPSLVEAAGVGTTVVLAPLATILAEALFQGTVNALLTFRVGCITKRYCRGMPVPDRRAVRRWATREAAGMMAGMVPELVARVTKPLWSTITRKAGEGAKAMFGRVAGAMTSTLVDGLRSVAARPFR